MLEMYDKDGNLDKTYFFVYLLAGYAMSRTGSRAQRYGFSHAGSVLDASNLYKDWVQRLREAFAEVPEANKDRYKLKTASLDWLRENDAATLDQGAEKHVIHGLTIVFGPEPVRPSAHRKKASSAGDYDGYGDAQQRLDLC